MLQTNQYMNNNLVKPLGDRVLVRPTTKGDVKTQSGIILTDSVTRGETVFGEVISVGAGIFTQTGERIPVTVNVGDNVMYKKDMSGVPIKLDNEEYLLFHEHELLMVIKK
jgi:chaperonin GroES